MIKCVTAYFLIFTILVTNSTRFLLYAGFEINQSYISSVLCENRDKPLLKCEGKCFLAKKIKQAEESEQSQERESHKTHFQDAFIYDRNAFSFFLQLIKVLDSIVLKSKLPLHSSTLFHPPKESSLS